MRLSSHRPIRRLPLAFLLVACVAAPVRAQAPDLATRAAQLKETQVRFMMRGAQRRANRARVRAKELKAKSRTPVRQTPAGATAGLRRQPAPRIEPSNPPSAPLGVTSQQVPASLAVIATNQLVNNRSGDAFNSGQCEVSIAAHGNNLVAAWNDGQGFVSGASTQGFAYSTDNGATWTDGGVPPVTGGIGEWTSDPVIAVNEKTGAFYYAALCDPTPTTNGVGVVKGTFSGGVFTWGTPRVAVSGSYSSVIFDKEWLVADSLTTNLYLIYSRFTVSGPSITNVWIDFTYNITDNASAWAAPRQISDPTDDGLVQGSRIAMGPAGEVWAAWNAIELSSPYADHMRIRKVTGGGLVFGAEATAVSQYTNFGTGAPGFNRPMGFAFPGLAVDRSTGTHQGRVYMTWNESINVFNMDDNLGGGGAVSESEPNGVPATGDPFTQSQTLNGSLSSGSDVDCWNFTGTAGQTIICQIDAVNPTLDASFTLLCSDESTRLGFSSTDPGGFALIVFTLPSNGTYTLRVAAFAGSGAYSIITGLNGVITERARDHRDVFTTYSDVVGTWTTPVRVNGEPGRYDDWLPEVAVAANGNVYVAWYDWRDAPPTTCGGSSMIYLSRSTDGGATWPDGSPVTTAPTAWTNTFSNIAPNQGDYLSLVANQNAVYPCWSDGRNSDPDIYMATVGLAFTAVQISLAGTYAEPGLVRVTWYAAGASGVSATVYRRTDVEDWRAIGQISPDGTGQMVFEDRGVTAGARYHYRLGLREGSAESFAGEVAIDVPLAVAPALAIQDVRPNPTDRQMWVSFSLPDAAPASLELIDVSGRRVRERTVSGAGRQMVDLAQGGRLTPGVYLVRLSRDDKSVVTRVSVVR